MRLSAGRVVLPLLAVIAFGATGGVRVHTQRSRSRAPAPTGTVLGISASLSTVTGTSPIVADDSSTTTVTITVKNTAGAAVVGATVTLASSGTGNTIAQPAATDGSGVTTGTMRSSVSELKTITATASGVAISQTADVWFVPFFEFAGLDGGGMGVACSGAAVTGSRGEPLTFARASDGTCMKHSELSGILPGDMVVLTTDQPRVQPGGDGTGALGLSLWMTNTNTVLYPTAIDNVAWVKGVGDTEVTADVALAPDNTVTADRVRLRSNVAYINQLLVNSAVPYAVSAYVCGLKTLSDGGFAPLDGGVQSDGGVWVAVDGGNGTGTVPVGGLYNASAYGLTACNYEACPSFKRCAMYNLSNNNGANYPCIGGGCSSDAGQAGGPADLLVWGVQEDLYATGVVPSVSPFIPSAGTPTARATETAFVDAGTAFTTAASFAVTLVQPNGTANGKTVVSWYTSNADRVYGIAIGGTGIFRGDVDRGGISTSVDLDAGSFVFNGVNRFSMLLVANTSLQFCLNGNGACASAQMDGGIPPTRAVYIGNQIGSNQINGTLKLHCADSMSTPNCHQ